MSIENGIETDWERLAVPQTDGYDTRWFARRAVACGIHAENKGPAFFGGRVALRPLLPWSCEDATGLRFVTRHPNFRRAEELLALWPQINEQYPLLTSVVCTLYDPLQPEDELTGSISGIGELGQFFTLVNHRIGFAESLVHELAHTKLRLLGIEIEGASALVANSDEHSLSFIRLEEPRPVTALLHAQYAFVHILAFDLRLAAHYEHEDLRALRCLLENNLALVPRLEFGHRSLFESLRPTEHGARFLAPFRDWSLRCFEEAKGLLERYGVTSVPFVHPLADSTECLATASRRTAATS